MKKHLAIGAAIISGLTIQATAVDSDYDPAAVIYYNAPLSSKASDYATASNFGLQLHHSPASVFKINPYDRKSRLKPILDLQLNSRGLKDFKSSGISVLRRDYSLNAEGGIAGIDWAVLVAGVVAAGVVAETVSDDDEEANQPPTGGSTTDGGATTDGGPVSDAVTMATDAVSDAVTMATDAVSDAVTMVTDAISDTGQVADAVTMATDAATDAATMVTDAATDAATMVTDAVTGAAPGFAPSGYYYNGYGYGDNGG